MAINNKVKKAAKIRFHSKMTIHYHKYEQQNVYKFE